MTIALDASAVLAVLNSEPGAEMVQGAWTDASISAANYSEVIAKLVDIGLGDAEALGILEALPFTVHALDAAQARRAGLLRRHTRQYGLSLGDRACLALAVSLGRPAMTADRAWTGLGLGIEVIVIR